MREPIGLADDDASVFAQTGVQQLALEQLCGAPQTAERIFDFMGKLPDHQPAAAELRQQRIFARQSPMLRDVLDLQQQARRAMSDDDLSNRAVEYAVDSTRRGPGQLTLNDALAARPGTFEEVLQGLGAARKFDERPAERLIGTQAQQGLTGGIQVVDVKILIEKKDAGHQRIEQFGSFDDRRDRK